MTQVPPPNRLQVWSAPALLFIHSLPRVVFPLVITSLLMGGLLLPNSLALVAGILLTVCGLLLLWLVLLSWPLLETGAKFTRVLMLLLVFGYAVGRFTGKL